MDEQENITEPHDPAPAGTEEFACELAQLAADRHCTDVVVLDLKDRSPIARYFVIGTGTSEQQIRSVAEEIATLGKHKDFSPYSRAGLQQGRWAVVDLVDIVVHLFDDEYRKFYDLELLWGDAPKVAWSRDETD